MRFRLEVACVFLALGMAGCVGGESFDSDDAEVDEGQMMAYRPINEQGELDLIYPTAPPREISPACRMVVAAESYRVLALAGSIEWDATSDRTRELRFELATGTVGGDLSIEGPSPLNLTAPDFDISAGGRFGIVLSLIGDDLLDPIAEPQAFRFQASFVAESEADRKDLDLGLWSSECS